MKWFLTGIHIAFYSVSPIMPVQANSTIQMSEATLYVNLKNSNFWLSQYQAPYSTCVRQDVEGRLEELQFYADPQFTQKVFFDCFISDMFSSKDYIVVNCDNFSVDKLAIIEKATGRLQLFKTPLINNAMNPVLKNRPLFFQKLGHLFWITQDTQNLVRWSVQSPNTWKEHNLSHTQKIDFFEIDQLGNIVYVQNLFSHWQSTLLTFDRQIDHGYQDLHRSVNPFFFLGADEFFYFLTPDNTHPPWNLNRLLYSLNRQLSTTVLFPIIPIIPSYIFQQASPYGKHTLLLNIEGALINLNHTDETYSSHTLVSPQYTIREVFLVHNTLVLWLESTVEDSVPPLQKNQEIFSTFQINTLEQSTFYIHQRILKVYQTDNTLLALVEGPHSLLLVELAVQENSLTQTKIWHTFAEEVDVQAVLDRMRIVSVSST